MRREARLSFFPLAQKRRADDWVIGYEPTGEYLVVDETGKKIIDHLKKHSIRETEKAFPQYDVDDIVDQLIAKQLVHKVDHRVVGHRKYISDMLDVSPRTAQLLTHPVLRAAQLGVIIIGLFLLIFRPEFVPRPDWFFAHQNLAFALPLAAIIWWLLQFLHELAHYLTLRRTGHATGLAITNKWHLLLPHTNIASARLLNSQQRALVHLAGIGMDLFVLSVCTVLLSFGVSMPLLKLIALLAFIDILAQLLPIQRTDLTRAQEHGAGMSNLPHAFWKVVVNSLNLKRYDLTPKDVKAADKYVPFVFIGIFVAIVLVVGYFFPILGIISLLAHGKLMAGAIHGMLPMYMEGLIATLLVAITISLYAVAIIRDHSLSFKNWFTWLAVIIFIGGNTITALSISVAATIFLGEFAAVLTHVIIGALFGFVFLRLLDDIKIEDAGFTRDFFLPIITAFSALFVVFALGYVMAITGLVLPTAIYALAYGIGMLSALFL